MMPTAACELGVEPVVPPRYTGKERDSESGNDYFGARYYASTMGRFLSPDWSAKEEPVPYAKLDNPQSLNLYAYVLNNPLIHLDADGHACQDFRCQAQSALKLVSQAANVVKKSFYLKVDVGVGLEAEVKGGPAKVQLGVKSVRETNAKTDNRGTVTNVDEASAKVKLGPVSVGPSISQEQTVQKGNVETPDAPKEVHGDFLYDVGKSGTGSNGEVGVGVGLFVGVGGSVEAGFDTKELVQGMRDLGRQYTDDAAKQTPNQQ